MLNKQNSLFDEFQIIIIILQLILHVQYRLHLFVSLLTNLEKKGINITEQKCPEKDSHCADPMIQSEIMS